MPIRSVLFDLDGTLADTAPDLAFALNEVRREHGLEALPYPPIRAVASHGAIALIRLGFGLAPDAPGYAERRQRLLDIYQTNLARETKLFPGMENVLAELDRRGLCWGVVTNKPGWLTEPLLQALGVAQRAACVVSGDTTAHKKPHPEPLLHACRLARREPGECVYIGDAERDIEAGRRAGMFTIAALFGYLCATDDPPSWLADAQAATPHDILPALEQLDRRTRS